MWAEFAPSEDENNKSQSGFKFYEDLASQFKEELETLPKTSFINLASNVLQVTNQFPLISIHDLKMLKTLAEDSPLQRSRLCLHPNSNDNLQEMMIYLTQACEIPISYHLNKDESLLVLEGNGSYDFYADESNPIESVGLRPYLNPLESSKDNYFFTRINRFIAHKINPGENGLLIYEATTGPFLKEDTQYMLNTEFD